MLFGVGRIKLSGDFGLNVEPQSGWPGVSGPARAAHTLGVTYGLTHIAQRCPAPIINEPYSQESIFALTATYGAPPSHSVFMLTMTMPNGPTLPCP